MLANVARSPCACTLVPACALIHAKVLRASTIGNSGRSASLPSCGLFDPLLTRGCREPQADEVRELERANFCGFFIFRDGKPQERGPSEREQAVAAFEALFRK